LSEDAGAGADSEVQSWPYPGPVLPFLKFESFQPVDDYERLALVVSGGLASIDRDSTRARLDRLQRFPRLEAMRLVGSVF
jgi:hypothetical protein